MTHWSSAFTRMAKWIIQHLQALLVNNPLMGKSYVWFIATDNWGPDSAVIGSMAHNSQKVEGKCSSWRLCEIMSARKVESCSSSWNCQSQTKKKKNLNIFLALPKDKILKAMKHLASQYGLTITSLPEKNMDHFSISINLRVWMRCR